MLGMKETKESGRGARAGGLARGLSRNDSVVAAFADPEDKEAEEAEEARKAQDEEEKAKENAKKQAKKARRRVEVSAFRSQVLDGAELHWAELQASEKDRALMKRGEKERAKMTAAVPGDYLDILPSASSEEPTHHHTTRGGLYADSKAQAHADRTIQLTLNAVHDHGDIQRRYNGHHTPHYRVGPLGTTLLGHEWSHATDPSSLQLSGSPAVEDAGDKDGHSYYEYNGWLSRNYNRWEAEAEIENERAAELEDTARAGTNGPNSPTNNRSGNVGVGSGSGSGGGGGAIQGKGAATGKDAPAVSGGGGKGY